MDYRLLPLWLPLQCDQVSVGVSFIENHHRTAGVDAVVDIFEPDLYIPQVHRFGV